MQRQLEERDVMLVAMREEICCLKKDYAEATDKLKEDIRQAAEELKVYKEKHNGGSQLGEKKFWSLNKRLYGACNATEAERRSHDEALKYLKDLRKRRKNEMKSPSEDDAEELNVFEAAAVAGIIANSDAFGQQKVVQAAETEAIKTADTADILALKAIMDGEVLQERAGRIAAESALKEERRAHKATRTVHIQSLRARDDDVDILMSDYEQRLEAAHVAHAQEIKALQATTAAKARELETWMCRRVRRDEAARIAAESALRESQAALLRAQKARQAEASKLQSRFQSSEGGLVMVEKSIVLRPRTKVKWAKRALREAAKKDAQTIEALQARVEELEEERQERERKLQDTCKVLGIHTEKLNAVSLTLAQKEAKVQQLLRALRERAEAVGGQVMIPENRVPVVISDHPPSPAHATTPRDWFDTDDKMPGAEYAEHRLPRVYLRRIEAKIRELKSLLCSITSPR
jgi:hypothetical protein